MEHSQNTVCTKVTQKLHPNTKQVSRLGPDPNALNQWRTQEIFSGRAIGILPYKIH
ncbi:hypothetical protein HanPI659440_Chr00c25g0736091 [Helianthus annuus]|nr:hypothetical protein HanPI659440_Chr00c25g0736091 [Helianthus annuus]